jgi:lysophospholipase L1-like esterase
VGPVVPRIRRHRRALAGILLLAAAFVGARSFASDASAQRSHIVDARAHVPAGRQARSRWVAGWSASPEFATARIRFAYGFDDQTVRNIVFTSAAGSMARVQFSNVFGHRPLEIGRAAIGQETAGAAVATGSAAPLTFSGRPSVVIAPGGSVASDRVRVAVRPLERLVVSVYLPHATGDPTDHATASQINYVAAGDHVLDVAPDAFTTQTTSWYFVTGVDVLTSGRDYGTVVAFGDSITDGARSLIDANARWPNDLARRLDSLQGPTLSVVDAGIAGNQILSRTRCCGTSGLARFARDVLSQPSVRAVIVLEGVNDIGAGRDVSAAQIIAGYQRLIAVSHAAGLKIFGATLTPFRGALYWTPAGEAKREAANAWIRHSGAFDGVIDFASAVADPLDPERIRPAYDSGDHLHPNDAGYRAMADAVSLSMLLRAAQR